MNRAELVALRDRIIMGHPAYTRDVMGNRRRETGTRGLEELKAIGDYSPTASGVILSLESTLLVVEHLLERAK